MSPILTAGISIVNLALISYTVSIILLIRKNSISKNYLSFLTIGVILDVTATICMIIASPHKHFTLHGLVGYSALTGMLIDLFYCYRQYYNFGNKTIPDLRLKYASVILYVYWLIAFITGAIIVSVINLH